MPVLLLAVLKQPHPHIVWNHTLIWALLYASVVATAFGFWGGVVISKELPPITSSLSLLGVPVCGVIASAVFLKEAITFSLLLAMLFILLGIICVIFNKKEQPKKTALTLE